MLFSWVSITCIAILLSFVYFRNRSRSYISQVQYNADAEKPGRLVTDKLSKPARLVRSKLVAVLPHIVITPDTPAAFKQSINAYWDQKACEVTPSCVVRPRNVWELAQVVKILKREFDLQQTREKTSHEALFAIRGGGHSPVAGASSIEGGILIDLALFKEIALAQDHKSVVIGAGCKWIDVSNNLRNEGIAVAGGRNSAVGVGGLTLGGGLSFFSPRFGFVCSNIIQYEIVLADGTVAIASETINSDLWRALKGGSNNFGIVTRFTARSFPSTKIWSGFLYLPSWQASKVLAIFHACVREGARNTETETVDKDAAGPLVCFTYLQPLGIQAIAVNLVHTNPSKENEWPAYWQSSGFSKLWRLWSTCTVRSLSSATDEMSVLNPSGRRQGFATTTIRHDLATLEEVHKAYRDAINTIRNENIKGLSWTLVLQPLLSDWARIGDTNVLGLESVANEPLIIVCFTVNWALSGNDGLVHSIMRGAIEQIDKFSNEHATSHRYRYLNYCASWQKPFEGYGKENEKFLWSVSCRVDPDGLFQKGCLGGFKLT